MDDLETPPPGSVTRELTRAFSEVVRSELWLARIEMKDAAGQVGRGLIQTAFFGALILLGLLPFLAFCVIGLGSLLNQRYWLSALIVAVVCFAVGGIFGYRAAKKITVNSLLLPHARRQMQELAEVARGKAA